MALPALFRRPLEEAGFLKPAEPERIAPMRAATPEDHEAPPTIAGMVSRSGDRSWFPAGYLSVLATNDDPILARDGSGLKLYDALLTDDTVMSTLQQRRLAITSRDWEVTPGDDKDPRSVKAGEDFRAMLNALGFDRVTGLLHYAVFYGYGVGEGLYEMRERDGRLIVWLSDIVVPDRRWFAFTETGELRFVAAVNSSIEGEVLPANKFITLRTGGTHDFAFYGLGLAHWCYWPVFFKRSALKHWALYLEKRGNPTVAVEFTEAQKDDQVVKDRLLSAAVAVGKDSAVLLPEGTLANDRLKILESQRSGGTVDYQQFLGEQNEAIMRVVLGQPGTSKGVSSGLNSDQAGEHADVKAEIVKADSDLISEGIYQFGKWLTRWNYGPDVLPPNVYRILDDGEDLSKTAKRDVDLDGIGIQRTEDSVKAIYGDGYELNRETPEAKAARELALAQAKSAPPVAAGAAADMQRNRIAQFAAQGGEGAFSPLYVSRKLLNADEVIAWAKRQGFSVTCPAEDLHVTILYSKTAVDWFAIGGDYVYGQNSDGTLTVEGGGPRFVERFGKGAPDDAVVLRFASSDLRYRHDGMIERGASSDFPDYKPHITISYDAADVDLAKVEPFTGQLRFGPEIFEPIKSETSDAFGALAFTAADEEAIERLIAKLVEEADPVFEAMGEQIRGALQGVETVEQARVAILDAIEQLPIDRLARLTGLPMLAERAAAAIGADELVDA